MRETWHGCYGSGWTGLIVPDAFEHPAKFARGLIGRIIKTGIERCWFVPGETTIIDPFAGVGLGGLAAAANGLAWTGCELEGKFVSLGQQNIDLHRADYERMGYPVPVILQGDSRRLIELLREHGVVAGAGVTSPPYAEIRQGAKDPERGQQGGLLHATYGSTPGQLGAMPEGKLPVGAITSPPYGDSSLHDDQRKAQDKSYKLIGSPEERGEKYGSTPGQIANLGGITSPPFSQPDTRDRHPVQDGSVSDFMGRAYTQDRQAQTEGNIAAMGGITSPPFVNVEPYQDKTFRLNDGRKALPQGQAGYGNTEGQIGALDTDSYWGAITAVLDQLWLLFPPGAVLAWVVKPFVRNKAIVDLPQMTLDLMLSRGWELVTWIDAMLVSEAEQGHLLLDRTYRKEDKSFFRGLHEKMCVHRGKKPKGASRYECKLLSEECPYYGPVRISKPDYCELYLSNADRGLGIDAETVLVVRKP